MYYSCIRKWPISLNAWFCQQAGQLQSGLSNIFSRTILSYWKHFSNGSEKRMCQAVTSWPLGSLSWDVSERTDKFKSLRDSTKSNEFLLLVFLSDHQRTTMTSCRQNFHEECEAAINKHINIELHASYTYQSMVSNGACHLVAIPGTVMPEPCLWIKSLQLIWWSGTRRWICGHPIFKWVAVVWQGWEGASIVTPAMAARRFNHQDNCTLP